MWSRYDRPICATIAILCSQCLRQYLLGRKSQLLPWSLWPHCLAFTSWKMLMVKLGHHDHVLIGYSQYLQWFHFHTVLSVYGSVSMYVRGRRHSLAPSLPTLFLETGSLSEPRAHQFIQPVWAVSSGSLRSLLLQYLYYQYVTQWLIGFCTCAESPHADFTLAQRHPLSEHLHCPW